MAGVVLPGIQEDLMNETIDEALADDDDEEQEDMIVGQARAVLQFREMVHRF